MRVHLVSEHASPLATLGGSEAGGQNVHVAALARALAAHGCEVVVHTRRDSTMLPRRVEMGHGVVVDHVDAGPPEPVPRDELWPYIGAFAADLERQWRVERPDAVHAHFWMSGVAAMGAGTALGIPVALTYHALGVEKRRHQGHLDTSPPVRAACEAWLAAHVDRVLATTNAERQELIRQGAPDDHVVVVPCGIDLDRFPRRDPRSGASSRRVVCASRLVERKGLADVVTAVAGLPDVELLIAGGPPARQLAADPHARSLTDLAGRLGIADRVRLLGAVPHDELSDLYHSAAVVCCTPWYEPFGLVALEAMACGVPVVATAVGGLAETIVDGMTGVLVPPHDPPAIRDAVAALLRDAGRRQALGSAGADRARAYDWSNVAAQTLHHLRTMGTGVPDTAVSAILSGAVAS